MLVEKLKDSVVEALSLLDIADVAFTLEHPADSANGDYSTNAALVASKQTGRPPREIADELARALLKIKPEEVEGVEVAGPGFINFYLTKEFFVQAVGTVLEEKEAYGENDLLAGRKVMVEYTDPNPFKVFHIGHLMPNIIGESLARIFAFSGGEVKRANYQGDVGIHVACALWGVLKTIDRFPEASEPLPARTAYLGAAYVLGAKAYEEDTDAEAEIRELNKKIFERSDPEINRLYDLGRQWSLDHFEVLYAKLGTKFDYYFFESEVAGSGKRLVEAFKERGVFEESDGAVVFRGDQYGLHTRVFLNKDGLPTYEAKELALANEKYGHYPYDLSFVVTANEINEYFKVLLKAMSLVFPDLAEKTRHIGHGMLKFATGKMSSRKGNVITGESLIEDTVAMAQEKMQHDNLAENKRAQVANAIGIGALKYAILRQAIGGDIVYDPDKSFSLEGDSGPYLQYAYVRAKSVLEKAKREGLPDEVTHVSSDIVDLERLLYQFPEVVERAAREYEPHHIVTYLTQLAGAFNTYYAKHKIVGDDPESPYRVALTESVAIVLKNGLQLLGIEAPERM
jgi:arginyl-tRNA synthetase